ncbi:hypothetical protein [Serratia fonticola]|uniref:hypothetical protein n=1 Tax=Serratia fonticola TaxID=47917 RepID=UPI0021ADBC11|nr:hypothetical protein [Serratia fonticola]
MRRFTIITIFFPAILTSCSWDPSGVKANQEWLAQKKIERLEYEKRANEAQKIRLEKQKKDKAQFEASHPEVGLDKIWGGSNNSVENKIGAALNSLDFVTRFPESQTIDNVYVKVGSYNLTLDRIQFAISGYSDECRRASAYNNANYKNICVSRLAQALKEFSSMLKNKNIPDKTKSTALGQASYRNYIDFAHAARLAKMHARLCQQKANQGYVEMVTVAVPCSGRGDVYNIYAARKMGFI